jgi:hypothetical protein
LHVASFRIFLNSKIRKRIASASLIANPDELNKRNGRCRRKRIQAEDGVSGSKIAGIASWPRLRIAFMALPERLPLCRTWNNLPLMFFHANGDLLVHIGTNPCRRRYGSFLHWFLRAPSAIDAYCVFCHLRQISLST